MSRPRPDYLNIVGVPQHPQHQGGALPSEQGGPDMTMPTNDSEYMREAREQREQELALAQIAADRDVKLAEIGRQRAEERRPIIGAIIGIVAGLLLVGVITTAILFATQSDRANKRQAEDRRAEVARECILAGNIWSNGDCLLTKKAG